MRKPPFSLAFIATLLVASCGAPDLKNTKTDGNNVAVSSMNSMPEHREGMPQAASTQPKDGLYPSRGKITKINLEAPSVELDHEEITGVMPPMLMEFYVKDKSLLDGLAVGDHVDFVLEYKHPHETIVEIKKSK